VQTDRPVAAAVQTVQGKGTYQNTASKDLIAEAVNRINYDRSKNSKNFLLFKESLTLSYPFIAAFVSTSEHNCEMC
jgi:hypothetical protein